MLALVAWREGTPPRNDTSIKEHVVLLLIMEQKEKVKIAQVASLNHCLYHHKYLFESAHHSLNKTAK